MKCCEYVRGTVFKTLLRILKMGPRSVCPFPLIKHSSLLGPFVTYEEIKMLCIRSQEQHTKHFIFFVTYKWPKKLECLSLASFFTNETL